MTASHWIAYGVLAAAALVAAHLIYARVEPAGRGRRTLALLRGAALALVLLLFFDPAVPGTAGPAGRPGRLVLLDASASMALPTPHGDSTGWARALAAVKRLGVRRVLLFGDASRRVAVDSLPASAPGDGRSLLAPALRAAAETGARRVLVLTDGRLEDAAEALALARSAGLDVTLQRVAPDSVGGDHALPELEAPAWAQAGKPLRIRVGVAGGHGTLRIHVAGGGETGETTVTAAAPGRLASGVVQLTARAPAGGGLVRYDVAVEPADRTPTDDHRSVYVYVAGAPAGVVLVSFRPDWEPRFLQPILAEALGMPARGFLRLDGGRYAVTGTALTAGGSATEAEVRRAVDRADLVVLHGFGASAPAWARKVARDARRLIVLPTGNVPAGLLPVSLPPPTPGDWYLATRLPTSPLTPYLQGIRADSVPPLSDVRATAQPAGTWSALDVRRDRVGPATPAVIAGQSAGRRWAVATGVGYWRWAFSGGAAREAYRALWSSLAGWLMRGTRGVAPLSVRPAHFAVGRGEPVAWLAPGLGADSLALSLVDTAGATVADTVVRMESDTAWTPAAAPGNYDYRAEAFAGGRSVATSKGPLTVERYSPDDVRPPAAWTAAGGRTGARGAAMGVGGGASRPLHTTPWPYLALAALLCAEWVLRRRWGLR